jgi:hypothetical protein
MVDKSAFIVPLAVDKNWRKGRVYQNIVGVTNSDLENGSKYIEKLKYPPWDSRNDSKDDGKVMDVKIGYGKYSHKTYSEVKNDDPRYFEWCCENIPRFKAKVVQLGLDD